jgi:hypothetical protein
VSLYESGLERPTWAAGLALLNAEFSLKVGRVIDALFAFGLVILPMIAMISLLFLLSSAEPYTASSAAMDGTGMVILPP